ncbi:beta adaptin [Cavenderia fasciculata]|uniref:AP-3 complex subunit beta n=1 Tax=Cavenderia fasciculata TaxID=261658 RepID=F4PQY8_CACFS|nr:beta adaptin [Cavenderia fasciculata]EGG21253.1 beta adaptin [Cavenderia fasciculata]|eukprot:XP_004359103.1 beta adaptin [Cavenderia fasciculata]
MNTVLNNINQSRYFNDSATNTKLEEIKKQLDGPSDKDKLECMKKLIAMLSKGRDVSEVFPQVVKNVIAKNFELKKLVYMYLVHYAEIEHDSALLAINTFQKSLSDKSQVIRASALRVMSSIRVVDIIQVIVLAIEKCVKDSSPYVRKAAAFAITKVHKLDSDKEDELAQLIESLLSDNSTMVLGAAMVAFNEVCPNRYDIIHQHYRKICQLLADFDEWSQVITISVLTKYARTQFRCPDSSMNDKNVKQHNKKKSSFYSDDEDDGETTSVKKYDPMDQEEIDIDHRLLLKSCLPLLQSRSNAVVMAVSSLYFYVAPVIEAQKVGKSLVRILHISPEVQYIALTNISTMVTLRPNMFEPYLSDFFIKSSDPEYSIKLKLEILTRLATAENISRIMKEFKEYVKSEDKKFAAATIQAIGTCAATIPDVTESCTHGIMSLLSNSSSVVVAECVIVLKRLLQLNVDNPDSSIKSENIIMHLAKLLDNLQVPSARAAIIWVIGEYSHKIPMVAPDVLRKLAKTFSDEDESVKLQILNLGAKLHFHNPEQTSLLFQYIINQAKFDMNYDVRDSARMMRFLLINTESTQQLANQSKSIFINQKPAPTEISVSEDRQRFVLGSLSQIVNHSAMGYQSLPDFPEEVPDPSVRQPKQWIPEQTSVKKNVFSFTEENFYSDEEEEDEDEYSDEYDGDQDEDEEDEDEEDSQDELDKFFSDSSEGSKKQNGKGKKKSKKSKNNKRHQEEEEEEEEVMDDDEMDQLFGVVEEMDQLNLESTSSKSIKKILLKPTVGGGLSIDYCFLRRPKEEIGEDVEITPGCTVIQLYLKNHSTEETISNIKIGKKTLIDGANIQDFDEIESIPPNESYQTNLFVTFNSTSQSCKFEICSSKGVHPVVLTPIIGELVSPLNISSEEWKQQFDGLEMQNASDQVDLGGAVQSDNILNLILESANMQAISANKSRSKFQFAGKSTLKSVDLFIQLELVGSETGKNTTPTSVVVSVRSMDVITATLLLKKFTDILSKD